jgi:exopolysaccharide biosynthesis WecB/TagA/CpsF family protein
MNVSRIAFYMHDLSGGGVERMRLALIRELTRRGLHCILVVGALAGELTELLPADLEIVELGVTRTMAAVPGLAAFLRRECPDVLISSLHHNNIVAILAARLADIGTRIVICQHNALSAELQLGWKYRVLPWLYWLLQSRVDGIVAVSRGVADDVAALAAIPRRRISVIYNPVVGADFAARAAQPPPHDWLAQKTCPVFVFVGRLTAQKDPRTLLHAMAVLLQRRDARAIIVGQGALRPVLEDDAARLGIGHAVTFAGFQADPLPWIGHADALVCPSRYEGFGNVIVEALACGTPVIACDCPHGPFEILLGGLFGRLVPVGNAPALAAAMDTQMACSPDRDTLRARAAAFSVSRCADAHLGLLAELPGREGRTVRALGMDISPLQAGEVIDRVVHERVVGRVRLVVTPNLHHLRLLRDPEFSAAYRAACIVCPDGFPVMLYARLCGSPLRTRVTGCDLVQRLIAHPALRHHLLFLVLESSETAHVVSAWSRSSGLESRLGLAVATPRFGSDPAEQLALALRIRAAAPSILMLTLGAPVSEVFAYRYRHFLPPCWVLCVGQALRVELHLAKRAPPFWRERGFEWLWRLGQEPRRLAGRYARACAWFPVAVARDVAGRIAPGLRRPASARVAQRVTAPEASRLSASTWGDCRIPPAQASQWQPPAQARSEKPAETQSGR